MPAQETAGDQSTPVAEQLASPATGTPGTQSQVGPAVEAKSVVSATTGLAQWKGLRVDKIEFEGVTFDAADTLPQQLAVKVGEPLDPVKVTQSIRRLFASGRYRDIGVDGQRDGNGVTLIFAGQPRYFVGRVTIEGVKDDRLASLLEYATKLQPGTAFTQADIPAGTGRGRSSRLQAADTTSRRSL